MNLPWLDEHRAALAERLQAGRLGHAPLIHGPSGVGKLELVRWLSARILCLAPDGIEVCQQCRACQLLASGTHPDLFELDVPEDHTVIPVDLVRELIGKMHLTPSIGPERVALIVSAEAMNRNAANALLKTLEEPAPSAWLILRSSQPASLPATIRSRCQKIAIRPPAPELAAEWLEAASTESTAQDRHTALTLSGGAPLSALSMLGKGGLERGYGILDHLLEAGSKPAAAVVEDWQHEAPATWRWLARWTALFMARAAGTDRDDLVAGRRLPRKLDRAGLAHLWQQALEGARMAESGSVRQDLLFGKWLLEWETLVRAGS